MAENEASVCDIAVGLSSCQNLSMNLSLGCHNNIVLHAADYRHLPDNAVADSGSGRLREVFWGRTCFPGWWRQLANESVVVFRDVQECDVTQGEAGLRLSLLKLSRRYRSCMRACMETLAPGSDHNADTHRQQLARMEMVWNLCEIILIQRRRNGVLYQLLDWVCQHAPQFDRAAVQVADAEVPESHPEYWNAVYGMVLQGRLDAARKLLRLHSGWQTEAFVSADELLRKMPVLGEPAGAAPVADFEQRWRHWQEQCIRRLEDGEFAFSHRLQTLVKILCGDAPTFEDLSGQLGSWYHLMVSYLLFSRPWAGVYDLSHAAEDSIEVYGGSARCSRLDCMLQAVVDGDVHALLKTAQATLPDGWLTAHLADLLHKLHTGDGRSSPSVDSRLRLEPGTYTAAAAVQLLCLLAAGSGRPMAFLTELRHHLLLEYGEALFAGRALWQLGAVYLDQCGAPGRAQLALLLERLEPETDQRARKIIQAAEARGLSEVAAVVARVMGQRARRAGRLGTALAWALRGDGAALAARLADTLVRDYTASGRFTSADLIDNLGSGMLKNDRLMFLGKYREFHRLHEEQQMQEAASLLVTLMSSQLAPTFFWKTLLTDAVPLLESEEVVISSAQTYDLIGCVEQLRRSGDLDESAEDVKRIRLALSRNLALAVVAECSAAC